MASETFSSVFSRLTISESTVLTVTRSLGVASQCHETFAPDTASFSGCRITSDPSVFLAARSIPSTSDRKGTWFQIGNNHYLPSCKLLRRIMLCQTSYDLPLFVAYFHLKFQKFIRFFHFLAT